MKTGRKLTALVLVALMLVSVLNIGTWTLEASASESESIHLEATYVNPLYAHLITEDDLVQPGNSVLYADGEDKDYALTAEEAAAALRDGMKARNETVEVYYHMDSYTKEDAEALMYEVANLAVAHTGVPTEGDYLKWQYGGWEAKGGGSKYSDGSADLTITYTLTYYTTADQEKTLNVEVTKLLEQLNVYEEVDYFKVKAIYDHICANVVYDDEHVDDTDYKTQYTAYGALIDGTAVCQGYAVLMYRLALELDVDCRLIAGMGKGEAHGWNIVKLDGAYYNLDATWDAGADPEEYQWFLLTDDNFVNHTRDSEYSSETFTAAYPMGVKNYVYCPGHEYDEGVVTKEATCSETGTLTTTCAVCGDTIIEEIPMLAHTLGEGTVTKEPTCAEDGITSYTCTVCNATVEEPIPSLDHTFDEGEITTDPTCTEEGVKTYTCTICSGTQEEPVAATGHAFETVVIASTCTKEGYDQHTCSTCGYKYTDNFTDLLPHNYTTEVVEPTCNEGGYTRYICADCGHEEIGDHTDPTTHTYTTVTVEPTCTSQGYDQHTCPNCGYKYSDNYTAPLDHSFEDGICTDCGARAVYRVYGETRYETAFTAADALKEELCINQFDTIIVANGQAFADALSGSYLAAQKNAPILLANGQNDEDVKAYIKANLASGGTVYLLGGPAALPETLETGLDNFKVIRLAGETRYETNLAILAEAGVKGQEILICTGTNFADSLSASATGKPVLLVGASLTEEQTKFLSTTSCEFVIVGGEAAINTDIETALQKMGNVIRLYGDDRFETSILVARHFFSAPTSAVVAYGYNFPDGLCGGPLAYVTGSPLILTATGKEAVAVEYAAEFAITQGYVLGGSGLVSDDTVRAIFAMDEDARVAVW